jgi:hypothetical protein
VGLDQRSKTHATETVLIVKGPDKAQQTPHPLSRAQFQKRCAEICIPFSGAHLHTVILMEAVGMSRVLPGVFALILVAVRRKPVIND